MELEDKLTIIRDFANNKDISKYKYKISKEDFTFFYSQSLYPLLYSIVNKEETDHKILNKIITLEKANIIKDDVQKREIVEICRLFEQNNIKTIILKGSVLKDMYKESYLRTMGDIDIYVDKKYHKHARKLLESLGYKYSSNYGHHMTLNKPPYIELEMHRCLLKSSNKNNALFNEIFDKCIRYKDYKRIYTLDRTYFMLYELCHIAKHYEDAGCGLRNLIDLYLYDKKYHNEIDYNLINKTISGSKEISYIIDFLNLSIDICSYKFAVNEVINNYADSEMFNVLVNTGIYGNKERSLDVKLKKTNKFNYFIRQLFPTKNEMKDKFSVLEKHLYLLPIFYLYRFTNPIIHPIKTIRKIKDILKHKW